MQKIKALAAAGAGLLTGYWFDPDMGKTRRAKFADRTKSRGRRTLKRVGSIAQYQVGVVKGAAHRVAHPFTRTVDDDTLAERIRSQAVGRWSKRSGKKKKAETHRIQVEVIDGTTVLSGEVPSKKERRRLLELVSAVDGVDEVEDRLSVG
jgi:osmotically-inducible protein OsmY